MSDHQSAPTTIDSEVKAVLSEALNDKIEAVWNASDGKVSLDKAAQAITNLIAQEANKATTGIVKALTNKGSHPAYHDEQMRYLETHWPTLYFELRKLITADKEQADE